MKKLIIISLISLFGCIREDIICDFNADVNEYIEKYGSDPVCVIQKGQEKEIPIHLFYYTKDYYKSCSGGSNIELCDK